MLFKNWKSLVENGNTPDLKKTREDILNILTSALDAVDPYKSVKSKFKEETFVLEKKLVDLSKYKNIYLVGFGKASVGMAQAISDSIDVKNGVVVTNDPHHKVNDKNISTFIGGHPLSNKNSIKGTNKILKIINKCNEKDLLFVLISGGGSALLCKPRISLEDLQLLTNLLLESGANINEINTIRKHLSFVKGGQLVESLKCRVISLILSDIVGDPIQFIASGPTFPDSTTFNDAKNILKKYNLWEKIPINAKNVIKKGIKGEIIETPKSDNPIFEKVTNQIVANNKIACKAAVDKANKLGYKGILLTTSLVGEAKEIGKFLVDKAKNYTNNQEKTVFISGGETTVKIIGSGEGGRNQEMVLSGMENLDNTDLVFASFATDGIDGKCDAAGAIADGFSYKKASDLGLDPNKYLKENDSYNFFKKLNDMFITGPTGSNVMDIQILIKSNYY